MKITVPNMYSTIAENMSSQTSSKNVCLKPGAYLSKDNLKGEVYYRVIVLFVKPINAQSTLLPHSADRFICNIMGISLDSKLYFVFKKFQDLMQT